LSTPVRIFLDANILFSAAKTEGAIRQLIRLLLADGHACLADAYVIEEARRNLSAKFPAALPDFEKILATIGHLPMQAIEPSLLARLPLPEKDRPVLAAAIQHRCSILVTGDRTHFGPLYGKQIEGVQVHSPRTLAETLL
jgi:predicted nucleic acid-binding protein